MENHILINTDTKQNKNIMRSNISDIYAFPLANMTICSNLCVMFLAQVYGHIM